MAKKKPIVEEKKSPDITHYYVEVLYFKNRDFTARKWVDYQLEGAKQMYLRTINKFTESKEQVIVCIRDSNHDLQVSERLNF